MWKSRESENPAVEPRTTRPQPQSTPTREFVSAPKRTGASYNEGIVNIGQSICIRGELTGDEDLTIEGRVEGKIDLKEHNLTIGPNGRIQAEVTAKSVRVQGEVNGNVVAGEKVELAETGRVIGDIVSPRIVIADGARFKGSVDMSGSSPSSSKAPSKDKHASVSAAPVITDSGPEAATDAARS
jgi:cytoskeletal protein CcmA (bactofilin family)